MVGKIIASLKLLINPCRSAGVIFIGKVGNIKMAYWIQEFSEYENRRVYHCDHRNDIQNLPKNDTDGVQQGNDAVACKKAKYGDICLCLEDASLWELRKEPNDWKEL